MKVTCRLISVMSMNLNVCFLMHTDMTDYIYHNHILNFAWKSTRINVTSFKYEIVYFNNLEPYRDTYRSKKNKHKVRNYI